MRLAIEEKRLTNDRLQAVDAERLGYEKGGLWRCPGQETLWIGRNENHRHGNGFEDLIDRFETRASVGELNVREDKAWPFAPNGLESLAMGARDIDDAVPLLLDEGLKVERNERLVLDDQDIPRRLDRRRQNPRRRGESRPGQTLGPQTHRRDPHRSRSASGPCARPPRRSPSRQRVSRQ